MLKTLLRYSIKFVFLLIVLAPTDQIRAADTTSLSTLYWCAQRTGNELQPKPGPDCEPLVEARKEAADGDGAGKANPPAKVTNLEHAVGNFLKEYRQLLNCCASDVSSFDDISRLEDQATVLIGQAVTSLPPPALLAGRNQGLVVPVVQARSKLRLLKIHLEQLDASHRKMNSSDYEESAKQRRILEETERSITKEFRPSKEAARALTGADIGRSGSTGAEIGRSAPTGTEIGNSSRTGSHIGTTPPTLGEIVETPFAEQTGTPLSTMQPVIRGTVGPEIGTTPSTGSSIGNSTLNSAP
ncbi:MAG: hypothetical protein H0W13_02960 [Nitrospirales bacterium]|nr:hypothetical protein [Nitrospirales bacterium]